MLPGTQWARRGGGTSMENSRVYGNCQVGYWSYWDLFWGQRGKMATGQPYFADLSWELLGLVSNSGPSLFEDGERAEV